MSREIASAAYEEHLSATYPIEKIKAEAWALAIDELRYIQSYAPVMNRLILTARNKMEQAEKGLIALKSHSVL